MLRTLTLPVMVLLCGATLISCGGGEFTDLDEFMAEQRARPGGVIAPIPPFKAYRAFSYNAMTLRSPFGRPVKIRQTTRPQSISAVVPDFERPRDFLEQFTFDSLAMVGTLSKGSTDWSLIRDPEGGVHRVREGNFLGRNHGKIVEMTATHVAVIEIVSNADDGWVERPRTIKLNGLN